jgi:hypothetical protein
MLENAIAVVMAYYYYYYYSFIYFGIILLIGLYRFYVEFVWDKLKYSPCRHVIEIVYLQQ